VPRWAIAVAVVVALVPATYLTAHRVLVDPAASPTDSSTDLPIPPVSPSATAPTRTAPTPSATPTTTPAAKRLPRISPDAPRRITSGAAIDSGFDSSVTTLDASSDTEVARWDPRGSPGSPGRDTVYVLGRVLAGDDSAFVGLPRLKVGAKVSIRTDNGTMTYTVRSTKLLAASRLAEQPLFRTRRAGRLVLVGIRYDGSGDRLAKALVVTAELTGARKG
jgi:hypothetical protein